MKTNHVKLIILGLLASSNLFHSCISQQEYIIESDYSYAGNFSKYRTFKFIINSIHDQEENHPQIEKTILRRLNAQGYKVSTKKPDLYILYKIYYDDLEFSGFNQPSFENWIGDHPILIKENSDSQIAEESEEERDSGTYVRLEEEVYDKKKYTMNEGTLVISFYDRKKRKTIWQGYASGVFNRSDQKSTQSIYRATSKIIDEFRLLADGYLLN